MSKKNIIILTIAVIFLLIAIGVYLYATSLNSGNSSNTIQNTISQPPTPEIQEETENFYFYDGDGNKLDLTDFSDKPIAMLFWKSDNSTSYEIIKLFEKYYEDYKEKINFLVVNVNEPDLDLEIVENVKAANFSVPVYFDTDLTSTNEYQYSKLPYVIFINKDGNVDKETSENITEDMFTANLDLLIENY